MYPLRREHREHHAHILSLYIASTRMGSDTKQPDKPVILAGQLQHAAKNWTLTPRYHKWFRATRYIDFPTSAIYFQASSAPDHHPQKLCTDANRYIKTAGEGSNRNSGHALILIVPPREIPTAKEEWITTTHDQSHFKMENSPNITCKEEIGWSK